MHKSRRTELRATQAVGLAVLLTAFRAGADTHYVDLNSTNPVPPFTNWSTAAKLIQEGANAADSGDTVRIAARNYYEQVVLTAKTKVTLVGEPGAVMHAFPGMTERFTVGDYPVFGAYQSDVVVSGIDFDGAQLGNLYPLSANSRLEGIYLRGSGGLITNCTFTNFCEPTHSENTRTIGVHCVNPVSVGPQPVTIRVLDSTFTDNQISMFLRGDPGSAANAQLLRVTAAIKGNSLTGLGPSSTINVGIWLVCGVAGDVTGNTLAGHGADGIAAYDAAAQSHGSFIPLQPLNLEGNTFTDNRQHIELIGGNESRVVNNKFLRSVELEWGALGLTGTNITVANNNFSEMPTGILLVGTNAWGSPWPPFPPAANPRLIDNWFCAVPEPIRVEPNVIGVEERGTETNCPVPPRFQSFTGPSAGEVRALLRGWHGDTVMLQASTNLVDWVPVHTHIMELPTHECRDMNTDGAPQKFYRACRL